MSRKSPPRLLTVLDKKEFTPNMWRITLGGPGMADFPTEQSSAYVKLRFHRPDRERPIQRSYTIRHQREDAMDMDFVRHPEGGPASRWAEDTQPGDTIEIGGPGPRKMVDFTADWFLLIGDMTALPAIAANIELLPADAHGQAIIEVMSRADIQTIDAPEHFDIQWIINPEPGRNSDVLYQAARDCQWLDGTPSIWCACEFNTMRRLREYLRRERDVNFKHHYISSYWQDGRTDEQHKQNKKADTDAQANLN